MTVEEVMQYRRAVPFKPFVLELTDGRSFVVREPEHIGRNEAYTQISVAADDDSVETIEGTAVARVRLMRATTSRRRKGKGR
ncbi:MAG TPA: hypothetical protein VK324_02090 [Tepidisphaeraceae bacterium]|nr:hypothetical protein [Tepidisphaeraceae bacterium]